MLNIIKRDVLNLLRDRGNLFFIVLFPSLLVFLLGNLLQSMDNADEHIDPIRLHYSIEATEGFELAAIDQFLGALSENSAISLEESTDPAESRRLVDTGAAAAYVSFRQPFGIAIYEGFDIVQNRAIDSIFRGFVRSAASISILAQHAPERLAALDAAVKRELVKQKEFGYNRTMLDYYAVAMVVMILFMGGGLAGAGNLYESRLEGTLRRMLASPRSRVNLYVQSVLGAVPQSLVQVACVMLTSTMLFGAHYADTLSLNLLLFITLFVAGLCVNAAGMIVGMFVKVVPTLILMPLLWVLMFLSGTFSKEIYIEGITNQSPAWLMQNAAYDLTVFGRTQKCLELICICAAILLVLTAVGALLFRRKEHV